MTMSNKAHQAIDTVINRVAKDLGQAPKEFAAQLQAEIQAEIRAKGRPERPTIEELILLRSYTLGPPEFLDLLDIAIAEYDTM